MNNKNQPIPPGSASAQPDKARPLLPTMSMTELYDHAYPPRTPVIDGLLYRGTYIFAGSPKIGKSFFMAQLGYHVAAGIPIWEFEVRGGPVLYLALEDDYGRLQGRLNRMFGVDAIDNFHLAVQARTLADGLNRQLDEFIRLHPDTKLIIVDTLQKIRETGNESYSYSLDYKNITALKQFSDRYNVAIIVVHHTRKLEASDSFDMISGTNGLMGAADGAIILAKKKRTDPTATMQIVGRDQQDQELTLQFDQERCVWDLTKAECRIFKAAVNEDVAKIAAFMKGRESWTGTATELLEQIPSIQLKANILKRLLNVSVSVLYNEFGIVYAANQRSNDRKTFSLMRLPKTAGDDVTVCDDDLQCGQEPEPPSQADP